MNASEVIRLRSRSPFTPFEMRLRDGSSVRVDHPYVIATVPDSPTCVVFENDEHMRIVSYKDVADVVTVPVNGS